jgi:uncharacterized metal-binding protein
VSEQPVQRIIFPCAGIINVGQITNCATIELTKEGYGAPACLALLASGAKQLKNSIVRADEIIILDGCDSRCAAKIAATKDVPANQHLVVTDLGIAKSDPEDYSDDDIEMVVAAVWEGVGRKVVSKIRSRDDLKSGCGCGSGCH